jgi:hypothetical protein
MASTAFADVLESVREAGTSRFSATNVADALGLQYQDLATLAGVHRNTLRTHPESTRSGCLTLSRLFAGSLRAGQRAAAVMSLLHSARLNGHDVHACMKNILERLPSQPASRVSDLLPHRWTPA